jgi:hypothetical protein
VDEAKALQQAKSFADEGVTFHPDINGKSRALDALI